jgi:hypothetical protein
MRIYNMRYSATMFRAAAAPASHAQKRSQDVNMWWTLCSSVAVTAFTDYLGNALVVRAAPCVMTDCLAHVDTHQARLLPLQALNGTDPVAARPSRCIAEIRLSSLGLTKILASWMQSQE